MKITKYHNSKKNKARNRSSAFADIAEKKKKTNFQIDAVNNK